LPTQEVPLGEVEPQADGNPALTNVFIGYRDANTIEVSSPWSTLKTPVVLSP
jgi:hypothetical protein